MRRQTNTGACDGKILIHFKGFAEGVKSAGEIDWDLLSGTSGYLEIKSLNESYEPALTSKVK
jgi:hypothetical protein